MLIMHTYDARAETQNYSASAAQRISGSQPQVVTAASLRSGSHYRSQSTCAFARARAAWKLSQNFLSTSRTCRGRCWSGAPSTGPADPAPGCVGAGVSSNSPSPSWPKLAAPAERRQARLQAQGSARETRIAGPKPIRETRIAGPEPFNCFHNERARKHASRPRL